MKNSDGLDDPRALIWSAIIVMAGIVLSGPPMVFLVDYLKPQPAWVDVDTYAMHFHRLQTLPYWFGFLLATGNILFIVSLSRLSAIRRKPQSTLALICMTIYASMVTINYSIQAIAVPGLIPDRDTSLGLILMTNPKSLCWTFEMVAYALLGVSYWLVAGAFQGAGISGLIKYLMIFNGIVSVLGIFLPVIDPDLLLESESIAGYIAWNILIVLIMTLVLVAARRKSHTPA